MHKLGASATLNPGDASLITLNDISDTGHMQGDGAMVQVMTGQAPGTEISYNWLHNSIKYGARFDGNGAGNNGMMHHNVMWGLGNSGIMAKGYEFKIFNNTVIDGPDNKNDILIMIEQGGNEGTLTHNNVSDRISGHRSGSYDDYPVPGVYTHNVNGYEIGRSVRDMLIDPDNLNFRPHPDSALVDAGLAIDGFTDGYIGSAPDIGAYEHGGEYWIPGITWNVAETFGDDFIEPEAMEFKPTTKEELQMAVDLWVSDNTTALSTYGPINGWDVSLITEMHDLFHDKTTFNDDIGNWDVSNVTDMTRMFKTCRVFNQDISGWDVSSVTTMNEMFRDCWNFNQDISGWDVSNVTN